jgi:hypothetical protein
MCAPVLKKSRLKPWLKKQWCIGKLDSEYLAQMEEVLAVYAAPTTRNRLLLCFDEKPYQLLREIVEPLAATPAGKPKRQDYEYERQGSCNILCAVAPNLGKRWVQVTEQRTKRDYAEFMQEVSEQIRQQMPEVAVIDVVQDNLNTHTKGAFYERFDSVTARALSERFVFHYTPKKGSWLNMAEVELSCLSRNCLDRRLGSKAEVAKQVGVRVEERNRAQAKISWQFSLHQAREKFYRHYKN